MLHRVRFRKDLQIFAADNPSTLSDHTKLRPPFGTLQHIPFSGSSKFWRRKGRKSLGLDLPFVFHITFHCVSTIFLTPSETKKKSPAIPSHSLPKKFQCTLIQSCFYFSGCTTVRFREMSGVISLRSPSRLCTSSVAKLARTTRVAPVQHCYATSPKAVGS